MKKIFIPLIALSVVAVSCKKETKVKDERLETLIKNKVYSIFNLNQEEVDFIETQ